MPELVIPDTSVLIIFDKINRLDILKSVYNEVFITPEILEEFGKSLPNWIRIKNTKDKKYQRFIETQLDTGEASAFVLAIENDDTLLILDDLKARKLAKQFGLSFTGTLGVIHKAKHMGVIDKIKPVVELLRATDFRISENVLNELLKQDNE